MVGGLRVLALSAALTLGFSCENPFLQIGSQCLFFGSSFSFDYIASADFCTALNGRLVTIDDPQKLRDIVDYTTQNLTQDYSYWVDGAHSEAQDDWLFNDGSSIPRGTPYWATFSLNGSSYGQEPVESQQQVANCLAIKYHSNYFFVSNNCDDSISPLCEQIADYKGPKNNKTQVKTDNNTSLSTTCGGSLAGASGEIMSPHYPDAYPTSTTCIWTVNSAEDVIIFTIEDLYVWDANPATTIEIRDGSESDSPLLGSYTHHTVPTPNTLVTSGKHGYVKFVATTNEKGYKGFHLSWISEELDGNCTYDYNSPTGSVRSPWYPGIYPPNLDCSWRISVDEGSYISLTVISLDTENATDIIQIRDGAYANATLLSKLSGFVDTGYEVTSSGNHLLVTFTSDSQNFKNEGFALMWTEKKLCPTPYLNVGQMCINFELTYLTFGLSGIACQEASGELASINNPQDLRDLYVFLQTQGIADTSFWIGGTDQEEEGVWVWQDGTLVPTGTPFWGTTGSHSEVQEPDGEEAENCLLLLAEGHHYFRDVACSTMAPAICMLSNQ